MSTTSTDPIADMLTRIRNAINVRKHEISLPHSNVKEAVARLLQQSNFIDAVSVEDARIGKTLTIRIASDNTNAAHARTRQGRFMGESEAIALPPWEIPSPRQRPSLRPDWSPALPWPCRRASASPHFFAQVPSSFCTHTPAALEAAMRLARSLPTVSADAPVCFAIAA